MITATFSPYAQAIHKTSISSTVDTDSETDNVLSTSKETISDYYKPIVVKFVLGEWRMKSNLISRLEALEGQLKLEVERGSRTKVRC